MTRERIGAGLLWVGSALLAGLAHPPGTLWWAVLSMPACLLVLLSRARRPFGLAWGWGFLYYTTLGLPLLYLIELQTGSLWLSGLGLGLLAGLSALLVGLFGWLVRRVMVLNEAGRATWLVPLGVAGAWTLTQWVRGLGEFAFVWGHLAPALAVQPVLIQPCEVLGTWGLEFLVMLWNGMLAQVGLTLLKGQARHRWGWLGGAAVLMAGWLSWGAYLERVWSAPPPETRRVAIVQPNVNLARAYHPAEWEPVRAELASLIRQARGQQPDLVVFPEVMEPYPMPDSPRAFGWWRSQAQEVGVPLLTGGYRVGDPEQERWTNTMHLFLPDGSWRYHDKVQLVPLGEHVPYRAWLGFLNLFGVVERDLLAGEVLEPLEVNGMRLGVVICMESTYPWVAREQVRRGANLLVVGSNESWFGRTAALDQHLAFSVLRAVETRRWLVRAAPEGVSAFIQPSGAVQRLAAFEPQVRTEPVGLEQALTVAVRWGDWMVLVSAVCLLGCAGWGWWVHRGRAGG